jgi:hypothetical protein
MIFRALADAVALFHAAFVIFVVFGSLIVIRWPGVIWIHLPAAMWGAAIEFGGWTCPLTPIENVLRSRAGEAGYAGGFVDHYIFRALYPDGLTPAIRWSLGAFVLIVNALAYGFIWNRRLRSR